MRPWAHRRTWLHQLLPLSGLCHHRQGAHGQQRPGGHAARKSDVQLPLPLLQRGNMAATAEGGQRGDELVLGFAATLSGACLHAAPSHGPAWYPPHLITVLQDGGGLGAVRRFHLHPGTTQQLSQALKLSLCNGRGVGALGEGPTRQVRQGQVGKPRQGWVP